MFRKIEVAIRGTSPLCVHCPQGADPLCQHPLYASFKAISKKRNKTEEDHIELSRLEWMLSLYIGHDGRLVLPGRGWEAALKDTAKRQRLGKKFTAAVQVGDTPILFPDQRMSPDQLWESRRYMLRLRMTVGTSSVMRTLPQFAEWGATLSIGFMDTEVDEGTVRAVLSDCGYINGSWELRPRYGRFEIVE